MDNLRFIRETMERAGSFTAVSGWGEVGIGLTALVAAYVASLQVGFEAWAAVWLVEACLSLAIAGSAMVWKARSARVPLLSGPGQKFALSFSPPILAGAILTAVLYRAGTTGAIPGVWLLLYGTAVVTGGSSSVRVVVLMGVAFMLAGIAALAAPYAHCTAPLRRLVDRAVSEACLAIAAGADPPGWLEAALGIILAG